MTGSWVNSFSFSTRGAQVGAGTSKAEDFREAVLEVGLPLAGDLGGKLSNTEVNAKSLARAVTRQRNLVAGPTMILCQRGRNQWFLVCGASQQGWDFVGTDAQAPAISSLGLVPTLLSRLPL